MVGTMATVATPTMMNPIRLAGAEEQALPSTISPRQVRDSVKNIEDYKPSEESLRAMTLNTTMEGTIQTAAPTPPGSDPERQRRRVRFSYVEVRNYKTTIGDNLSCLYGPPLSLSWDYRHDNDGYFGNGVPVEMWEATRPQIVVKSVNHRRKASLMLLNPTQRCARLFQAGYSMEEMRSAVEELMRERFQRGPRGLDPLSLVQEVWLFHIQPVLFRSYNKNKEEAMERQMKKELSKMERRVRAEHESQYSSQHSKGSSHGHCDLHLDQNMDLTNNENEDLEDDPENTIVIEGMDDVLSKRSSSVHSHSRLASTHDCHECDHDSLSTINAPDASDESSSLRSYGISVDRKQHDKATEIILSSFRRPHMRAFHASWFSFFMAFFCWFSITPLLGEVKLSLGLTKKQVWMSSLMGTLSTAILRIIMGPLCDKFGARLCMAAILITASIPTAFTGCIQTSTGLSIVRLFIGTAGASFVACQYWTSDMFTRDVAGTANALAAGWGNLGGGAANLFMGSVLFPLLRLILEAVGYDDWEDLEEGGEPSMTSSELAWRILFIIPAVTVFATGVMIVRYCDDSPTGSYRDRIRNERMTVTSPYVSFCASFQNWNVWVLTFQYACCFGVEVTMTNATALYFIDEFGQSTPTAAAISSIFGIMNLFARGLGGFGSDYMNKLYGVRGRIMFQIFTLALEGVMVMVFAYTKSLAPAIVALVALSCMVQASEGSTFGIVPYVDPRFTGSVVGLVGSGGTVGAVLFSVFFTNYSYQAAFLLMGISASSSAVLSFFMNTKKISQMQEALTVEVKARQIYEDELYAPTTTDIDLGRDESITKTSRGPKCECRHNACAEHEYIKAESKHSHSHSEDKTSNAEDKSKESIEC